MKSSSAKSPPAPPTARKKLESDARFRPAVRLAWLTLSLGLSLSLSLGLCLSVAAPTFADPPGETVDETAAQRSESTFARRVLPLLKEKCFGCHGNDADDVAGELNMLSHGGLLTGGESGEAAIVPGDADASLIVKAIRWDELEMPPKENDRLTPEQIGVVEQWVKDGAVWPNEDRIQQLLAEAPAESWGPAGTVRVSTSGGLDDDWTNRGYQPENLWAYQPLWRDTDGLLQKTKLNPIDVFIDSRLEQAGLAAAPRADRRTLLRRTTFNLTGLPPTPEEIADFLNDPRDHAQAYAAVVDRLLGSPHYGERWAQHWLDVVRYADSSGYANDFERGNAWRYRDYVVRSFNDDKPFDEFVRQQVAGDEIDPSDPENLVAAGFLRMGPWELTGMEVAKVARQRFLDDVTDAVGQVFLGHMLQCARCHDHKFDPIPTRDYYSMQAIFATTQLAERHAPFLDSENQDGFDEAKYLQARKEYFQKQLEAVNKKETIEAAREWFREQSVDSSAFETVVADLSRQDQPATLKRVRAAMARRKISPELIPPKKSGFEPRDFGVERIARKELQRLNWRLDRYKPIALSVYSGRTPKLKNVSAPLRVPEAPPKTGELEQPSILTGGDPFSPSQPVTPSALSAVQLDTPATAPAPQINGRRQWLAEWITNPNNPLTARVIVNRIWQWHFGKPLAGNPNNFGATGKKPTHPELLDYVAQRFMDDGWSIKTLHRLILSSEAYQRSSVHPDPASIARLDSDESLYARFLPRRLSAEELRDAMLSCSGELNRAVGGIPVRPEMNLEAALQSRMVMGTFAEAWQPSPLPSQRHRRSIYALKIRGLRDPFMEVFNAPTAETSCEQRESSMVTPQVFSMFNSEISLDRALAMANRLLKSADSDARTLERLFQIALGRSPSPDELDVCLQHWASMTDRHRQLNIPKSEPPTEIERVAVEENTGVKFSYLEPLEMYHDFVPDLKPADCTPRHRGLAEVCLILLNTNEFAYVD